MIGDVLAGARDWHVEHGDALEVVAAMPSGSVHCVITSPPYYGLRNYGVAGQIGLEASLDEYLATMVDLFEQVRRVIRPDGTCWLNLGDVYTSGGRARYDGGDRVNGAARGHEQRPGTPRGLKPKDLIGLPWRVAFALQAAGWWLRSDIVWAKPNPMPESVQDRPTRSHEFMFLLTRSGRYFYDADAIREPYAPTGFTADGRYVGTTTGARLGQYQPDGAGDDVGMTTIEPNPLGRNRRDVWTIATEPFPAAHFATFPTRLVEPCVRAGTSERGVCSSCGTPWRRELARKAYGSKSGDGDRLVEGFQRNRMGGQKFFAEEYEPPRTVGWKPGCDHDAEPVGAVVLDPFAGSGTTGLVARRLGRRFVGVELNPQYAAMARGRIYDDAPLFEWRNLEACPPPVVDVPTGGLL